MLVSGVDEGKKVRKGNGGLEGLVKLIFSTF